MIVIMNEKYKASYCKPRASGDDRAAVSFGSHTRE